MQGRIQGKYGFHSPTTEKMEVVNVGELEKVADESGNVDLGRVKVLGKGKVTKNLTVSAANFSNTAKEKIEAAGGEVVIA